MKVIKNDEQLNNKGSLYRMSIKKSDICIVFSARLKKERVRLNKKQSELAELCGISVRTWGTYERGVAVPDSVTLVRLDEIGFDVYYLITGRKLPVNALNLDEQILLERYRRASVGVRFGVNNILEATT